MNGGVQPTSSKVRLRDAAVTVSLWVASWTKLGLFFTTVISPVGGLGLVTLGSEVKDKGDWALLIGGLSLMALGGVVQLVRQFASGAVARADELQAARYRIAMKDIIQPIAAAIAAMPSMNDNDRRLQLNAVAEKVSSALITLLRDVYRLRAIVYMKNKDGGLDVLSYNGRADEPQPFEKGTERGDAAMRLVARGGLPRLVVDIQDKNDPEMSDFHGTGIGYRTFVTGGIGAGQAKYGMVSIDAPDPKVLVDTDRHTVGVCADLMAIAFAMATPASFSEAGA